MSLVCGLMTDVRAGPDRGEAFGHGVMEGIMALSLGGRGPAERGLAIDFLIVVTL